MPTPVELDTELSISVTLSGPTEASAALSETLTSTVGIPGLRGATWYSGVGVPDPSIGANLDYFLNETTGEIYKKAAGVWSTTGGIMKGPQGDTGEGVPSGGAGGQTLRKASAGDYDTEWVTDVTSVFGRTGGIVPETGDLDGVAINLEDEDLTRANLADVSEQVNSATGVSGSMALDYTTGPVFERTLSGSVTVVTLTDWPPSGTHGRITLYLDSGPGGFSVTGWPAGVTWLGDDPPDLSERPADFEDIFVFTSRDSGASIWGVWVTAPAPSP